MAKSENQKIKLLRLYEILKTQTDENNPLKAKEIIELLKEEGIECERKTLYKDIELLQKYGIDIQTGGYKYYLAKRQLSLAQIRFLMDAVQSVSFLTKEQTNEMCAALSELAGSHQAELLKENVICFDKVKHFNNEVLSNIEKINRAIENDKKVSFKYFHIGLGGERIYKKNGERYEENPVGLVFNGGSYYLVCLSEKYNDLVIFRVDRISSLHESYCYATHSDTSKQFTEGDIKDRITAFGMWKDKTETVTIAFDRSYVEDIYDKFGRDVRISKYDENYLYFTEKISISHSFYGWCASYGTHVKIIAPQSVKEEFINKLSESASLYGYELKEENK